MAELCYSFIGRKSRIGWVSDSFITDINGGSSSHKQLLSTFILSSFFKGPQAAVAAATLSETLVLSLTHQKTMNKKKIMHPSICHVKKWPSIEAYYTADLRSFVIHVCLCAFEYACTVHS